MLRIKGNSAMCKFAYNAVYIHTLYWNAYTYNSFNFNYTKFRVGNEDVATLNKEYSDLSGFYLRSDCKRTYTACGFDSHLE